MYIRGLIPRNFTELAEAVRIDQVLVLIALLSNKGTGKLAQVSSFYSYTVKLKRPLKNRQTKVFN